MSTPTTEKIDSLEKNLMHAALLARALEGKKSKTRNVTIQHSEKKFEDEDCKLGKAVDDLIKTLPDEVSEKAREKIKTTLDDHFKAVIQELKNGYGLKNSANWKNMQESVLGILKSDNGYDTTKDEYKEFNKNLKELLTKDNNQKLVEEMERLNRDMEAKREFNHLIMLQEGMLGYIKASTIKFDEIDHVREEMGKTVCKGSPINKELKTGHYRDKDDPKSPIIYYDEKTGTARPVNVMDKKAWEATIKFMAQKHASLTLSAVDKDTLEMLIGFALDAGREIKLSAEADKVISQMLASNSEDTEALLKKIKNNNKIIQEQKGAALTEAERGLNRDFLERIYDKKGLDDAIANLDVISNMRNPAFDNKPELDLNGEIKIFQEAAKVLNDQVTNLHTTITVKDLAEPSSGFEDQKNKVILLADKIKEVLAKIPVGEPTDKQTQDIAAIKSQVEGNKTDMTTLAKSVETMAAKMEAEKVEAHSPSRRSNS